MSMSNGMISFNSEYSVFIRHGVRISRPRGPSEEQIFIYGRPTTPRLVILFTSVRVKKKKTRLLKETLIINGWSRHRLIL